VRTAERTLLVAVSGPKDVEDEMAHSVIRDGTNSVTNAITDITWFAERTQHDLFRYWFEEELRAGASRLDVRDQPPQPPR
jgi:hypothetical protein